MNIKNKITKIGLFTLMTLGLSYTAYSTTENKKEISKNSNSDIEKLIKEQYSNQNYELMSMKDSNKGVVERPSEKEFTANRKTQTIIEINVGKKPKTQTTAEVQSASGSISLNMTREELMSVADRIFQNETGGSRDKLVHWNSGENFPSLGIGHFIWFKASGGGVFGESFPDMVSFYKSKGIQLPKILEENRHSPWSSRSELMAKKERGDKDILELIEFFDNTRDIQVMFIFERLKSSLDKMMAVATDKENLKNQFYRMVNTPNGLYALIDYVNFKGEGLKGVSAYNNQAWGLRQVLENMKGTAVGYEALEEFSNSAMYVLEKRVRNAPRNESKWLKGWFNRVNTYKTFEIDKSGIVSADISSIK